MNARELTFHLLYRLKKTAAYSNLLLDSELKKAELSAQDVRFATALFYGVIEKQIYLDYQLSRVLRRPIKKLRDEVLIILRMGVYQLQFMDKVPDSAAINESVKLAKKNRCAYASGLVNAALRSVQRNGALLPNKTDENYFSVRYSVPQFLIQLWEEDYGKENAQGILESLDEPAQLHMRVNTMRIDAPALCKVLAQEGVNACIHPNVPDCLVLEKIGDITCLQTFRDGLFHMENAAAQMAALLVEAKQGERVLDVCAAPGGKTFTMAEQMKQGEIFACDLYESRTGLILSGAQRLKIDFIHPFVQDATVFNEHFGLFDRVLCDVPCSGLGIIRSKPEIRYKTQADIAASAENQYAILCTSFRYLKPGGILVYATCTLHKAENETVVERFLSEHKATLLRQKTFFPHIDHTDGFFAAVLQKDE